MAVVVSRNESSDRLLALRGDRLGLSFLLQRQHRVEHRDGGGLRLPAEGGSSAMNSAQENSVCRGRRVMNSALLGREWWAPEAPNFRPLL